jgi:hypothetical protein
MIGSVKKIDWQENLFNDCLLLRWVPIFIFNCSTKYPTGFWLLKLTRGFLGVLAYTR